MPLHSDPAAILQHRYLELQWTGMSFDNKSAGTEMNLWNSHAQRIPALLRATHLQKAIVWFIFYLMKFFASTPFPFLTFSNNKKHLPPRLAKVANASAGLWAHSVAFAAASCSFNRQMEGISAHLPAPFCLYCLGLISECLTPCCFTARPGPAKQAACGCFPI